MLEADVTHDVMWSSWECVREVSWAWNVGGLECPVECVIAIFIAGGENVCTWVGGCCFQCDGVKRRLVRGGEGPIAEAKAIGVADDVIWLGACSAMLAG